MTQYAMGDVEALGLLKMDFLGLRNLDVIDEAVRLVARVLGHRARPGAAAARRREDVRAAGEAATRPACSSSSRAACATRCGR